MDVADLAWEVYRRYISRQSYRRIGQDLGIGKTTVPEHVKRVMDGEFGEPPDEDPEMLRGLAQSLERNGWSPDQVMAWAALFEEAKAEGLDPRELAAVAAAFAKASRGVCDPSEYLSTAARLARAEEAGGISYQDVLTDYGDKLEALKKAEERIARLISEEESLKSRIGEMRQERDELQESLKATRAELAEIQDRVVVAGKEASSVEKRFKGLEANIGRQLRYREKMEKEISTLRQARDALIPEIKDLQTRLEQTRQRLEAEEKLLAETVSMRREAAAIVDKHLEEIQMAKDLVQLIARGEFNPYGGLFHEIRLAMAQADGTITEIESLALPSDMKEIEHRLFSFISMNWRGRPLLTHAVIINTICSTRTKTGLKVDCVMDTGKYPTGLKVTDQEYDTINIEPDDFHGEWNYTIHPQT